MSFTELMRGRTGALAPAGRGLAAPRWAAMAALFLLSPILALAAVRHENFEKTVPAAGIQTIRVQNVNGDVAVVAGSGDTIRIEAEKTARGGDADEILRDLEIRVRTVGDKLEIETVNPKKKKLFGFIDLGSSNCCSVRYAIQVPLNRGLAIETVNGAIDVASVEGKIHVETVNGSIALSGVRGEVVATTVNGSVSVVRVDGLAATKVETVNGNVEVAIDKASSSFAYEFETVNGRIESDFPLSVGGKYGPKNAHGQVGAGGVSIAAESVNGSIRLRSR